VIAGVARRRTGETAIREVRVVTNIADMLWAPGTEYGTTGMWPDSDIGRVRFAFGGHLPTSQD
jgi:hypothetical protein